MIVRLRLPIRSICVLLSKRRRPIKIWKKPLPILDVRQARYLMMAVNSY